MINFVSRIVINITKFISTGAITKVSRKFLYIYLYIFDLDSPNYELTNFRMSRSALKLEPAYSTFF